MNVIYSLILSSLLAVPTFIIYFIETVCYITQARLKFTTILMPQTPKRWALFLVPWHTHINHTSTQHFTL